MAEINPKALCELCCAIFARRSSLVRHIKNVHFPERSFICEHCSKSYITKSNLLRHITSAHSNLKTKPYPLMWQCPLCIFESDKETMVDHYKTVHNVVTAVKEMSFKSFDDFQRWKQNFESETSSKYIRYRIKKCHDKIKYYYRCHRDGLYKGRGNSIRRLKRTGSNKINGHCPAKIDVIVTKITEMVSIKYINSHVGHKMELSNLCSSKSNKQIRQGTQKSIKTYKANPKSNVLPNKEFPLKMETEIKKSDITIGDIKNTFIEQFHQIINKIKCPEQFDIVKKHLTVLESVLDNCNKL